MNSLDSIVLALCWLAGSAILGVMGWIKSTETWNTRKFLTSVLSGTAAALAFGVQYRLAGTTLGVADIITAILAGMGIAAGVPYAISTAVAAKTKLKARSQSSK